MCENWNLIVVRLSSEHSKVLPFSSFAASARADDVFIARLIKSRVLNDAGRKETQEILIGFAIPFHPIEGLTHETHIICQNSLSFAMLRRLQHTHCWTSCCVVYRIEQSLSQPTSNERTIRRGKKRREKRMGGIWNNLLYWTLNFPTRLSLFSHTLSMCLRAHSRENLFIIADVVPSARCRAHRAPTPKPASASVKWKIGEEKEKKENTEVEVTSLEVFDSSKSVDIFNLLSKHL